MMTTLPIVGGTEGYLDPQLSPERTINMYQAQIPGTEEKGLIAFPGSLVRYTNVSGTRTRQLFASGDDLFGVYEDQVVRHDADLNAVLLDTLNTTSGHVGIKGNNSKQIVFVDNVNGWVYDYSGAPSFTQITDPGFPSAPADVDFLDGHILVAQSSSNRWYISNIDDAATWNALNYAELTSDQEIVVGIRVVNRRIFIFGRFLTEVFYNSNNASIFPFVRDNNMVLQFGCGSVGSIAQDENILVWLATQKDGAPSVRYTDGGPAKKISNPAVEYALQRFAHLSDTCGYLFNIDGYTFYALNNPADNQTFLYSFALNDWTELQMLDGSAYFGCTHAFYKGKHYLGHYNAPKLSELNSDFTTNDAENMHCVRIASPVRHPTLQRLRVNRLEVQGKQGSGAITTKDTGTQYSDFELDPQLYLSVSHDNGVTYSGPYKQPLGKVGQYNFKTVWSRLGIADSFTFKFELFNAARAMLLRASVDIEGIGY